MSDNDDCPKGALVRAKRDRMIVNGREYLVTVTTPGVDPADQARREKEVVATVVGALLKKRKP